MYEKEERMRFLFSQIKKYEQLSKAAVNTISIKTKQPMSSNGIRQYFQENGYRLKFVPRIEDQKTGEIKLI